MSAGSFAFRSGNTGGYVFPFLAIKSVDGFPYDQPMIQEEVLETAGVDGRRWRTVNKQHETRVFETVSDYTSFALAVQDAKKMLRSKGGLGSLSITAASAGYFFTDVHVQDVRAIVSPGAAVGTGANSASAATVRATWSVAFTNLDA